MDIGGELGRDRPTSPYGKLGEYMDAVKVKMDSIYKLLTNQNSLGRNAGTSDTRGCKKDFR
ncbi:hypothetical protein HID58_066846, partial [Brassica napus]